MLCLGSALVTLGPRFFNVLWWLVDQNKWNRTFNTFIFPFLGILFIPWTILMYVLVCSGRSHRLGLDVARACPCWQISLPIPAAATTSATASPATAAHRWHHWRYHGLSADTRSSPLLKPKHDAAAGIQDASALDSLLCRVGVRLPARPTKMKTPPSWLQRRFFAAARPSHRQLYWPA